MDPVDKQLAEGIAAGEEKALALYVEKHKQSLLSHIRKNMSRSLVVRVDPQDILQETIIHAMNALDNTAPAGVSPHSWLCRLAEQRIVDAHRRYFGAHKRSANLEVGIYDRVSREHSGQFINFLMATLTTPTQMIARDQKIQALLRQFDRLPPETREAVRLRYVEGLSSSQIAAQLGKNEGAIRVMLTRGLKKLRQSIFAD